MRLRTVHLNEFIERVAHQHCAHAIPNESTLRAKTELLCQAHHALPRQQTREPVATCGNLWSKMFKIKCIIKQLGKKFKALGLKKHEKRMQYIADRLAHPECCERLATSIHKKKIRSKAVKFLRW